MEFGGKRVRVWLPPTDLTPNSTPILGEQARRQIEEIDAADRRLAKRLTRAVVTMVDDGLLRDAESIDDPDGIGPRFLVDLLDGYVAAYWVVFPKGREVPVVWVEQVKLRERFEAEIARIAPSREEEEE
jgi:hypothetical protein